MSRSMASDVVHDLTAGLAVEFANRFVADVNVIPTSAGEDDREVIKREVVLQKVEQADERRFTLVEHLGVGGRLRIHPGEVIGVEVEDEIGRSPSLLSHRRRAGIVVARGGKVACRGALSAKNVSRSPRSYSDW